MWRWLTAKVLEEKSLDGKIVGAALVVVLLCAAFLRGHRVDSRSLEADEIFTVAIAAPENSLPDVASLSLHYASNAQPPLYFLVTHFFLSLGDHDFLLRFPSLAAGVLGVAATYAVGAALFGREEGLIAAFLLCISPLHIRYSQWARFYAFLMMFSSLSLYFLYRGMHEGQARSWVGFIATTVLNLYTHLFALLVLLSQNLFLVLAWLQGFVTSRSVQGLPNNKAHRLRSQLRVSVHRRCIFILIASMMIVLLAYSPMVPHFLSTISGRKGIAREVDTPGLELSPSFFRGLLGEWSGGSGTALVIFLVLFFVGILASLRNQRRETSLILLWIGVPFAVVFTVPMKQRFYPRYVIFMLPIYLIVIARGLTACDGLATRILARIGGEKWGRSWVGVILGLMLLGALSLSSLQGYYGERASDWRATATFLGSTLSSGDAIMVRRPQFEVALLRYDDRLKDAGFSVVSPRDPLPVDLQYEQGIWFVGKEGRNSTMSRLEEELVALTGGPVFKLVFEGCGNHYLPGAGEHMFWDVWVLYARQGLDRAQLINLYRQALDTVPRYAVDFVHKALQDLSMGGEQFEAVIDARQVAIGSHLGAPEDACGLPTASCEPRLTWLAYHMTADIRGDA